MRLATLDTPAARIDRARILDVIGVDLVPPRDMRDPLDRVHKPRRWMEYRGDACAWICVKVRPEQEAAFRAWQGTQLVTLDERPRAHRALIVRWLLVDVLGWQLTCDEEDLLSSLAGERCPSA